MRISGFYPSVSRPGFLCFFFAFAILATGSCSQAEKKRTDPARKTTRIVAFGHTYYALHDGSFPELIDSVIAAKPDIVVTLGDLVWVNTEEEWESVRKELGRIHVPVIQVPGNHDLYNVDDIHDGVVDGNSRLVQRFKEIAGPLSGYMEHENVLIAWVNSCDSIGAIRDSLTTWQATKKQEKPFIVFSHHCFWEDGPIRDFPINQATWHLKGLRESDVHQIFGQSDMLICGDWNKTNRIVAENFQGKKVLKAGMGKTGDRIIFAAITVSDSAIEVEEIEVGLPEKDALIQD